MRAILRIRDTIMTFEQFDPEHRRRDALVVTAANTYFPEAGLDGLPSLARAELLQGLRGPLRRQIAAQPEDPNRATLRDALVDQLGGSADCMGALTLVDHVYQGRLVHGKVPPIITANCVWWYRYWRGVNNGPSITIADAMQDLAQLWMKEPDQRDAIDAHISAEARAVVGDDPPQLTDVAI